MKALKMTIISLPALALLLALGVADEAQARIRVKATYRTPHGNIQVDNGTFHHTRGYRQNLPTRHYDNRKVSKRDRRIARRLGRYTGVPKRELIQLKRMGYTWREIGNWLGVSRRVVRAAKSGHRWERFLDNQSRNRFREVGGYCDH